MATWLFTMDNTVLSLRTKALAPILLAALTACGESPPPVAEQAVVAPATAPTVETPVETGEENVKALDWDSLIPPAWRPETLMAQYGADELSDDDPRAQELMEQLKVLWDQAPVVTELDGAAIKLPGFVVPLQSDSQEVTEFLLVPYYGACIHVPPPPANQTVYVVTEQGQGTRQVMFDTVWVTGTLSVKRSSSDLGEAGYTLYASSVTPYEE